MGIQNTSRMEVHGGVKGGRSHGGEVLNNTMEGAMEKEPLEVETQVESRRQTARVTQEVRRANAELAAYVI